ncbi:MAG: large subunit ribosomal protein [Patescibacteria group bacterium]|nr:large subunit ribosomal protein [Patescibacteria group bacterium]
MATAHATLSNFRQSPRKMRVVANLIRGKKVADVLTNLQFVEKRASLPIRTLISSALANARTLDIPTEALIVKTITVNPGKIMYRRIPAARGSAHPIRKRTSSVFVELAEADVKKKTKVAKEVSVVAETKTAPKAKKTVKAKTK